MSDSHDDLPGVPHVPPAGDPANLDPASFDLKGGGGSKAPIYIGVALLVLGAGGFGIYRMLDAQKEQKAHAAFMETFQQLDKEEMSKFWTCILGKDMDPGLFSDNLAITKKIDTSFATDPLHYPDMVQTTCVAQLEDVTRKAGSLSGPADYEAPLAEYKKTLAKLGEATRTWAEGARTRAGEKVAENKVIADITAFHSVAGVAPPEAIAYASFLRCAVPESDKLKDTQALLELLFDRCKKSPEFIHKAVASCGKLAEGTDGKPDAKFKATLKKYGPDDRDIEAFKDCFRRSQKESKDQGLEPFGRAWVSYMEASGAVRKVGADKLKKE